MNDEILTIKQFAELAGVTQQAVYKQLNNKLKNYIVIVDGKKRLKKAGLKEFSDKPGQKIFSTVEQPDNNQFKTLLSQNQQVIDMLQRELQEKNEQIAELQRLVDQQQRLSLVDHNRILELEEKAKAPEHEQDPEEPPKKKKWLSFFKNG